VPCTILSFSKLIINTEGRRGGSTKWDLIYQVNNMVHLKALFFCSHSPYSGCPKAIKMADGHFCLLGNQKKGIYSAYRFRTKL